MERQLNPILQTLQGVTLLFFDRCGEQSRGHHPNFVAALLESTRPAGAKHPRRGERTAAAAAIMSKPRRLCCSIDPSFIR